MQKSAEEQISLPDVVYLSVSRNGYDRIILAIQAFILAESCITGIPPLMQIYSSLKHGVIIYIHVRVRLV